MARLPVIFQSRFTKNVSALAGSAVVAQGISLLASPVLTRLYDPSDFGVFSQFFAIVMVLQVISGLRYEIAIPLAEDDATVVNIAALALVLTLVTSALTTLVITVAGSTVARHWGGESLVPFLWLVPIGMLGGGLFQALSYWAVREKNFGLIARMKVRQSLGSTVAQLGLGLAGAGSMGLILGGLANQVIGSGGLAKRGEVMARFGAARISLASLRTTARTFGGTALASSLSGVINTLGGQLPFLLITSLFGAKAGGFFMLSNKVFYASSELIGNAVAQTYYGEASSRYREDRDGFKRLFLRTSISLLGLGLVVAIAVWVLAPWGIALVFGEKWREAGMYARYLTILFLFNLVCSPVSTTVFILNKQHIQVVWDVFRLLVVAGCLYGAAHLGYDAVQAVLLYSIGAGAALCLLYFINLALVLKVR